MSAVPGRCVDRCAFPYTRTYAIAVALALCWALAAPAVGARDALDMSGTWEAQVASPNGPVMFEWVVTDDDPPSFNFYVKGQSEPIAGGTLNLLDDKWSTDVTHGLPDRGTFRRIGDGVMGFTGALGIEVVWTRTGDAPRPEAPANWVDVPAAGSGKSPAAGTGGSDAGVPAAAGKADDDEKRKLQEEYAPLLDELKKPGARAGIALADGRYDEAIELYTQALREDPSGDDYRNRGRAYLEKGDLKSAVEDFNRALEIDRGDGEAMMFRGVALEKQKDFAAADRDFEAAPDAMDKDDFYRSEAYFHRARSRDSKGRPDDALADYTAAIELNDTASSAYLNRGLLKIRLGKDGADAQADLDKAVEISPDYKDRLSAMIEKAKRRAAQDAAGEE